MTFKSAVKTFLQKLHLSPDSFFTSSLKGEFAPQAQPVRKEDAVKLLSALDEQDFTTAAQLIGKSHQNAIVSFKDVTGTDPMMHMAQDGNIQSSTFLMSMGDAVRAADNDGRTALMYAGTATMNCEKMIDLLIESGADLSAKNNKGETVIMDIISHSGIKGATHILKKHGAGKGGVTLDFDHPAIERALRVATVECEFDFCALVEAQRKAQAAKPQAAAPQTPKV